MTGQAQGRLRIYANEHGDSCSNCHRLAHYQDDINTYCGPCARNVFGHETVRAVRLAAEKAGGEAPPDDPTP